MSDELINDADRRIIKVLQDDGRVTNRELADQVALSPSPCLARRKRLEEKGVIRGYRADLDLKQVAPQVLIQSEVSLVENTVATARCIESYISQEKSIIYAVSVSGAIDYILTFCVPNIEEYQNRTDEMIEKTGIKVLTSHIVLNEIKRFQGYPVDILLPPPDRK